MPVHVEAGESSFVGVSTNIGLGGLFLATSRPLLVGDRLTVQFSLPAQALPIVSAAEVRWIRDAGGPSSGCGLQFVKPSIAAVVAIQEFLREVDPDLTPSSRYA
jgi:uncharacterized protein (TIGR02266 family)